MAKELEPRHEAIIDRAVRDFGRAELSAMSQHPSLDELVSYQQGSLGEKSSERVRRHLASCQECTEDVLDLEEWVPEGRVDPALLPTREEAAAKWRGFRQRLSEEEGSSRMTGLDVGATRPGSAARSNPPLGRSRLVSFLPLAASIFFAAIGIASWLGSGVKGPGPAETNPFVFDLIPDRANHSRAAMLQEVEVPAGMDLLVPRLNLGDQTPHTSYHAEIFDTAGKSVWRQNGLIRQPAGDFTVLISRQQLPAGTYRLRLLGGRVGEEAELATFSFLVRYLPAE